MILLIKLYFNFFLKHLLYTISHLKSLVVIFHSNLIIIIIFKSKHILLLILVTTIFNLITNLIIIFYFIGTNLSAQPKPNKFFLFEE